MEAKKRLARTIVGGFWGVEAARAADEQWARQFQQKDLSTVTEEIRVDWLRVVVADAASLENKFKRDRRLPFPVNVAKLLVALGICESRTAGERQADAGVEIDGVRRTDRWFEATRPSRVTIRVGRRAKIAVIE
jgi:tyrosyl-tRNA synthetase